MFKKFTAVLLILVMLLSLLPVVSAAEEEEVPQSIDRCCYTRRSVAEKGLYNPGFSGKLIEITPQRVEDTFRYLDDFYIDAHPEAALMNHYGTEEDRAVLLQLAQTVTAGCTTQKEMADAVANWIRRNIVYDVNTSAYATDTFYRREGNCLSYAFLLQTMLRSLGIPAVLGDGWRGDMEENTVELFGYEGHAWVFVYLDGKWELYDPLWLEESTTDWDYMAKWIYFDTVEFVVPAYDEDNLPPVPYGNSVRPYYTGKTFHLYGNMFPDGVGSLSCFINNIAIVFVSNQNEPEGSLDGRSYAEGGIDISQMVQGQIYTDGWLSYGDYRKGKSMALAYAHPNGMMIDGAVMEFDGKDYYMFYDSARPILADKEDYIISDGLVTFPTGYTGPYLDLPWMDAVCEGCTVTITNETPEIAVVSPDNSTVTCLSEGFASVRLTLTRDSDNALLGSNVVQFQVSDEERIPDFTDHGATLPDPEPDPDPKPDPEPDPDPKPDPEPDPDPKPDPEPDPDPKPDPEPDPDPEPKPDPKPDPEPNPEPIENPFNDIKESDYYAEPVLWAVENGITNGTSASTFSPNAPCTRGQIVTFLWRACGSEEPTTTENPFKDVKAGEYYYKAVLWAVEKGITAGLSATEFGPNATCTRGQVATFLWRSQGKPAAGGSNPFKDVKSSDYYYEAVLWAVEAGVTQGVGPDKFAPNDSCTRGQIVTFLYRALEK